MAEEEVGVGARGGKIGDGVLSFFGGPYLWIGWVGKQVEEEEEGDGMEI